MLTFTSIQIYLSSLQLILSALLMVKFIYIQLLLPLTFFYLFTSIRIGIKYSALLFFIIINIGPQHPSTHGVLRLISIIYGEVIQWIRSQLIVKVRSWKHDKRITIKNLPYQLLLTLPSQSIISPLIITPMPIIMRLFSIYSIWYLCIQRLTMGNYNIPIL